ncbi:MAG: sulfurtransferase TusA family protein [Deltaproteobacteria bacterium]
MIIKTIDARGLSCPQPVVLAKNAVDEGIFPFVVIVDTEASKENVSRFAKHHSLKLTVAHKDDGSATLTIDK